MWPYLEELFEDLELHKSLAEKNIAVLPSSLRDETLARITEVLEKSSVEVPKVKPARSNQRSGRFSEYRGYILAEMQSLARQHPGATGSRRSHALPAATSSSEERRGGR